jgi:hypothetical protein
MFQPNCRDTTHPIDSAIELRILRFARAHRLLAAIDKAGRWESLETGAEWQFLLFGKWGGVGHRPSLP